MKQRPPRPPLRVPTPTPDELATEREAVERIYQALLARAIADGDWMSGDERVNSDTACKLTGHKLRRFQNLCCPSERDPIPTTRIYRESRPTHHLFELAGWLYRQGRRRQPLE